eukprot:scaffold240_cov243-Pinguiococcus_pyrenoidosus.AAC.13
MAIAKCCRAKKKKGGRVPGPARERLQRRRRLHRIGKARGPKHLRKLPCSVAAFGGGRHLQHALGPAGFHRRLDVHHAILTQESSLHTVHAGGTSHALPEVKLHAKELRSVANSNPNNFRPPQTPRPPRPPRRRQGQQLGQERQRASEHAPPGRDAR